MSGLGAVRLATLCMLYRRLGRMQFEQRERRRQLRQPGGAERQGKGVDGCAGGQDGERWSGRVDRLHRGKYRIEDGYRNQREVIDRDRSGKGDDPAEDDDADEDSDADEHGHRTGKDQHGDQDADDAPSRDDQHRDEWQ